jgi:hypothetical protein
MPPGSPVVDKQSNFQLTFEKNKKKDLLKKQHLTGKIIPRLGSSSLGIN